MDAHGDAAIIARLDGPYKAQPGAIQRAMERGVRAFGVTGAVRRIVAGMLGPGRLTIDEAALYGVPALASLDLARSFVGKKAQKRFHAGCNDPTWYALAHNKALFYSYLVGQRLPIPQTLCEFDFRKPHHSSSRGPWVVTGELDTLLDVLRSRRETPLFIKPTDGIYSVGAHHIEYLGFDDVLVDGSETVPLSRLLNYMKRISAAGFLVQDFCISSLAGFKGLPSLRFLVLNGSGVPRIESVVLKLPSGGGYADNLWREGNALVKIDNSGVPDREAAYSRNGDVAYGPSPESLPPVIPDWRTAVDCVKDAAALFGGIRTQSWDVGLSVNGPVLLEVNFGGDLNLHQIASRRGALTSSYAAHLAACGVRV